ncbi:MAG: XRE family transcriptional regulator [Gemmatimonadota bacterium]
MDVGARLRTLRRRRGWSLRDLARASGLSVNAISRIERNESSPTVASLQRLATALDIPLVELFRITIERSTVLVRATERPHTATEGVLVESLGTGLPSQKLGPFLMTLTPGVSSGDEPIVHGGEEFVHCIAGEVEYLVGDEWYLLRQGDSLLFFATQPHLWRNRGREAATMLVVILAPGEERQATQQKHLMRSEGADVPGGAHPGVPPESR